ncbi:MAG: hypothetical protein ACTSWX_01640 [Promethearchaeota archaeon]
MNQEKNIESKCDVCGNSDFFKVGSSILINHYSFITSKNLVECSNCGAKYIICLNCGSILNKVHLALDVFKIKNKCLNCMIENVEISNWIAKLKNRA